MATDNFQTLSPGLCDVNGAESLFHEAPCLIAMDNLEHPDLVTHFESEDPIGTYSFSQDLASDPRSGLENSYLFPCRNEPLHCKTEDHDDDDNISIPDNSAPSSPGTFSPVGQTFQNDTSTTLSLIHRSAGLRLDDRTLDQMPEGNSSWGLFGKTITANDPDDNLALSMCKVRKSTRESDASTSLALLDDINLCPSSAFESPTAQQTLPSDFTFTKFGQNIQGDAANAGVDNTSLSSVGQLFSKKSLPGLPLKTSGKGGANRCIKKLKEPALNLSYPARQGKRELKIIVQPEEQHRARYLTEGSRGAIKDHSQNAFPVIQLCGFDDPVRLQIFIGSDQGKVKPHGFYQACQVCGKNASQSTQRDIDGTTVIEMQLQPTTDMIATIDCVGILKLRNADVEQRIGLARSKKRSTKSRMVFRVNMPNADGTYQTLQVASHPILCTQPAGAPEITKKCFDEVNVEGGQELFIIGKNFSKGTTVCFVQLDEGKEVWSSDAEIDQDNFHQTHMIITVPPYKNQQLVDPVEVQIQVHSSGRVSENCPIQYKAANIMVKEEQVTVASSIPAHIPMETEACPLAKAVSPVAREYNKIFQEAVIKGEMTSQLVLQSNITSEEGISLNEDLSSLQEVLKQEVTSPPSWITSNPSPQQTPTITAMLQSQSHGQKRTIQQILNDEALLRQEQELVKKQQEQHTQQQQQLQQQQHEQQLQQQQQQEQQLQQQLQQQQQEQRLQQQQQEQQLQQQQQQHEEVQRQQEKLQQEQKHLQDQQQIQQQHQQEKSSIKPSSLDMPLEDSTLNQLIQFLGPKAKSMNSQMDISEPNPTPRPASSQIEPDEAVQLNSLLRQLLDHVQQQQGGQKERKLEQLEQQQQASASMFVNPQPIKSPEQYHSQPISSTNKLHSQSMNSPDQYHSQSISSPDQYHSQSISSPDQYHSQSISSPEYHSHTPQNFISPPPEPVEPQLQEKAQESMIDVSDIVKEMEQLRKETENQLQQAETSFEEPSTFNSEQIYTQDCPQDIFPDEHQSEQFASNQGHQSVSVEQPAESFDGDESKSNCSAERSPDEAFLIQQQDGFNNAGSGFSINPSAADQTFLSDQQSTPMFSPTDHMQNSNLVFQPTSACSVQLTEVNTHQNKDIYSPNQTVEAAFLPSLPSKPSFQPSAELQEQPRQTSVDFQDQTKHSSSQNPVEQSHMHCEHPPNYTEHLSQNQTHLRDIDSDLSVDKACITQDRKCGGEQNSVLKSLLLGGSVDDNVNSGFKAAEMPPINVTPPMVATPMPTEIVTLDLDDLLNYFEGEPGDQHNKVQHFLHNGEIVNPEANVTLQQIHELQERAKRSGDHSNERSGLERREQSMETLNTCHLPPNQVAPRSDSTMADIISASGASQAMDIDTQMTQQSQPLASVAPQQVSLQNPVQQANNVQAFPVGSLQAIDRQLLNAGSSKSTEMPPSHSIHESHVPQSAAFVVSGLQQTAISSSMILGSQAMGVNLSTGNTHLRSYTVGQLLNSGLIQANVKTVNQVPLIITPDLQKSHPQQQVGQQDLLKQPQVAIDTQNSKMFQAVATSGPQLIQVIPSSNVHVPRQKLIHVPDLTGKGIPIDLATLLSQKNTGLQLQCLGTQKSHVESSIPTQRQPIMAISSSTPQSIKPTLTQPIIVSTGRDSKGLGELPGSSQPQTVLLNLTGFTQPQNCPPQPATVQPQIVQQPAGVSQPFVSLAQQTIAPSGAVFGVVHGSAPSNGNLNPILVNQPITIISVDGLLNTQAQLPTSR